MVAPELLSRKVNKVATPSRQQHIGHNPVAGKLEVMRSAHCACGGNCPDCKNKLPIQTKLSVSKPSDAFEQEAERTADQVMSMPDKPPSKMASTSTQPLSIQRLSTGSPVAMWSVGDSEQTTPAWFDKEHDESLLMQRRASNNSSNNSTANIEKKVGELTQNGESMSSEARSFFEPRFGTDFSGVRIHADAKSDQIARSINAEAFTVGSHIAFRSGRYAPQSESGRHLLAHELTHVVQQSNGSSTANAQIQRRIGDGHDLTAPRFAGNVTLEAVFDGEVSLRRGTNGEPTRLIQESLRDMGYALPLSVSSVLPGRMDGDYGAETEATVRQFQTDAGAVGIDGIVGPETMNLLNNHDVSTPTNRPPPTTGPVPAPLAATDCNASFAGVTFTLTSQIASGTANPALIAAGLAGGRPFLRMRGRVPITYTPNITIAAPSNARAQEFRIGFSQTLLNSSRVATYGGGGAVATVVPTLPIKDGAPNDYHPIYVTNPVAGIVEDFTATGSTAALTWPDVPSDGAFINRNDNPSCAGAPGGAQTMTRMRMNDHFRIWVVVQHRPSGCVRALHHVDWNLDWSANVGAASAGGLPAVTVTSNVNNVTQPDGDGSPRFVQGGNVPGEIAVKTCV